MRFLQTLFGSRRQTRRFALPSALFEELEPRLVLSTVPAPEHVVVVIEENHGFDQIIGSKSAPYINSLAQEGALMTQSFAIEHPSQPNYLDLFSGSNQGVQGDGLPSHLFSAPNLGGELLANGLTFTGYSEGLPQVGFNGKSSGNYVRKHNPWVNFTDIPATDNRPFSDFPSDFNQLPDVSFVVPNLQDDMHDGSIAEGDSWLKNHLDDYVQWAKTNNSLLIVTWDEDDFTKVNQIPTLFVGPMVTPGHYDETINHFSVLRTLEDAYGLPYAGASATALPITDIWTTTGPSLTSSTNSSVFGQLITLTATAGPDAGTPVGTATFMDGATPLGTVDLAGGTANFSTSDLTVGTHAISVTFSPGTGITDIPRLSQVVSKANTTTTLAIVSAPGAPTIVFQATVTSQPPGAGTPGQTVTFHDRKKILGTGTLDENGQATLSIPAFRHGKHLITATYSGDDNFNSSQSAILAIKKGISHP